MTWHIQIDPRAAKNLAKLGSVAQKHVLKYLKERIAPAKDPRVFGKALSYDRVGLWRYRVDDYRIICHIQDDIITVLVLEIGHRKEIYD